MIALLLLGILAQQSVDIENQTRVDYVVLDIVAHDENGNPVTDLTPADFQIRDGRKKQKLAHFETLDFRDPDASGVQRDAAIEQDDLDPIEQTLIVVLDFGALKQDRIDRTMAQLERLFERFKKPRPIQMFLYSMDAGPISRHFSTNALEVLDDLVMFESQMGMALEDSTAAPSLSKFERELSNCVPKTQGTSELISNPNAGGLRMIAPCMENAFRFFVQAQELRSRKVIKGVQDFINLLSRVPGLKSVYMISPGFSSEPGQAAAELARNYVEAINTQREQGQTAIPSTIPTSDVDDQSGVFSAPHFQLDEVNSFAPVSMENDYRMLADAALSNRIVVHSFNIGEDPKSSSSRTTLANANYQGLNTERIYFSYERELNNGLAGLAKATGGSHRKSGNLAEDVDKTLAENAFYYVLAYERPKVSSKKFRKVRVKCTRKGVTLKYRNGYFPKP